MICYALPTVGYSVDEGVVEKTKQKIDDETDHGATNMTTAMLLFVLAAVVVDLFRSGFSVK